MFAFTLAWDPDVLLEETWLIIVQINYFTNLLKIFSLQCQGHSTRASLSKAFTLFYSQNQLHFEVEVF